MAGLQPKGAASRSWDPAGKHSGFFPGWTVVAACFLSMNFSVGITFAAYGPLVVPIQEAFGTSRAMASSALSATGLTLGLCAPLVGGLVQRYSARAVMMGGATLVMLGFLLASLSGPIFHMLNHDGAIDALIGLGALLPGWLTFPAGPASVMIAIYGTFIGAGFVAMGIVPCSTLVTRWFNARRGLALGIINLFPGMALFPVLVTWMVGDFGLKGALLGNAVLFALLLPALLLIRNKPEDQGLEPLGGKPDDPVVTDPAVSAAAAETTGTLLGNPAFWLLSLGIAMLTGIANILTVHMMPMLLDAQVPATQASLVLFVYGMSLAFSAPAFGAIIDRIGPFRTLLLEVAIVLLPWVCMAILTTNFANFIVLMAIVGVANGGIVTLHTSTAARLFSAAQYSRAMGLGYFVKMPFLFIGPPLAGRIYDVTGNYELAILGGIVTILISGTLFAILLMTNRAKPEAQAISS